MLKLLHISDVHIGSKLDFLGVRAGEHRQRIWQTLESAVTLAIEKKVQLVIFSGDVFDTFYPATKDISHIQQLLLQLAKQGIYTVILPGNHDRLEVGSVWLDMQLDQTLESYVGIFRPYSTRQLQRFSEIGKQQWRCLNPQDQLWELVLPELDTSILGIPVSTQRLVRSPLAGFSMVKDSNQKYKLGMAHGPLETPGGKQEFAMTKAQITDLELDYLALGDWHSCQQVTPKSCYAGAIEILARDQQNSGQIVYVEIVQEGDKNITKATAIVLSKLKAQSIELNLAQVGVQNLAMELQRISDQNLILTVTLVGTLPVEEMSKIDLLELEESVKPKFYSFRLIEKLQYLTGDATSYPENSVQGEFLKLWQDQVGKLDPVIAKQVLSLGLHTLNQKRNVH